MWSQESLLKNKFKLIYRGSQDGFSAHKFHENCDFLWPTCCLIKSTHNGKIFGGITDQPWIPNGKYMSSEKSFLFSLDNMQRFIIKNKKYAILGKKNYGPIFGEGHDLCISSDCNSNVMSHSNLGESYASSQDQDLGYFISGTKSFRVDELEIYVIY